MATSAVAAHETGISERGAARILEGAGLARSQALRVLRPGLAGEPTRLPGVTLYDSARVIALAARDHVDLAGLREECARGLFVLRLTPRGGEAWASEEE
jgi:hypothetical protein